MIKRNPMNKTKPLLLASAVLSLVLGIGSKRMFSEMYHSKIPYQKKQAIEAIIQEDVQDTKRIDVEEAINDRFNRYFNTYSIGGKSITLNMPFGENCERSEEENYNQAFYHAGKGEPTNLWKAVHYAVKSPRFNRYISELKAEKEKVVIFDLKKQKYDVSSDKELVSKMKKGKYPGNSSLVYIYKKDGSFGEEDVYNYLYCISRVGTDCSGFVYNIQKAIASEKGINLDRMLAKKLGVRKEKVPIYIGTWLYNPENGYTENVEDRISNIKAGDMILFRGKEGKVKHSAVVQSVDKEKGIVRYMQSTDWAPQEERGVHESLIIFNPKNPNVSLKDKSLIWKQKISPTFKGEQPIGWRNDGDRYRAYRDYGGGMIARLRVK